MRILHLSDIHFGREKSVRNSIFTDKNRILSDLADCIATSEKRIDHIIVTGDIAWLGKKTEFDEALVWFRKLLEKVSLSENDITFCPGNHDVNWGYGNYGLDIDKDTNIDHLDKVSQYSEIYKIESPLINYEQFCAELGVRPFVYPNGEQVESSYQIGYKDVILHSEEKLRIVSFNTAMLSFVPGYPDDKNIIGLPQINSLLDYNILNTDIYTLAIFHHAERFLHSSEICAYDGREATLPKLRECVDLILCGHTETGGKPVLTKQSEGAYMLTGGAAYYDDNHANSFSFIDVIDKKTSPSVEQYMYDNKIKKWGPRVNNSISPVTTSKISSFPVMGEMQGRCVLRINSDEDTFLYETNNLRIIQLARDQISGDNANDPCRLVDLSFVKSKEERSDADFSVRLTSKSDYSARARLKYLEIMKFINDITDNDKLSSFQMMNKNNEIFFCGKNIRGKNEISEDWLSILEKIIRIEDYFDIRFWCPNNIEVSQNNFIDKIIELIDGKIVCMPIAKVDKIPFTDKKEIEKFIKIVKGYFYIKSRMDFNCVLFEKNFRLENVNVVTGPFRLNKRDAFIKRLTFMENDTRCLNLVSSNDIQTYVYLENSTDNAIESIVKSRPIVEAGKFEVKWENMRAVY